MFEDLSSNYLYICEKKLVHTYVHIRTHAHTHTYIYTHTRTCTFTRAESMGSFLDKPITDKHCTGGQSDDFTWVVASMQGWRAEMEDAHTTLTFNVNGVSHHFFGVFDGHGGKLAARVSALKLHEEIKAQYESKDAAKGDAGQDAKKYGEAMVAAFKKFDSVTLRSIPDLESHRDCSGTTANVVYILPQYLVVANAGDSRSVVGKIVAGKDTADIEAEPMSKDHKPSDAPERARIVAAGGHVSMNRVDGDLAVSRALGDFIYKNPKLPPEKQKVSPVPDIKIYRRSAKDRYMILACDGIWDVMTNAEVVDFVHTRVSRGVANANDIATSLLDHCLKKGSRDNMSVIIIIFNEKKGKDSDAAGGVAGRGQ